MNFFSPNYLDSMMMWANQNIYSLAQKLPFKKEEFIQSCKSGNAQEADDILSENFTQLIGKDNVQTALNCLVRKFPELNLSLTFASVSDIKKKILILDEYADEMLKLAESRALK